VTGAGSIVLDANQAGNSDYNAAPQVQQTLVVQSSPTIGVSASTLSLGTTTQGTAGTARSFTVSGTNLTADILLTAPAGVELSDDGGVAYHATLDLSEAGGVVAATVIDARISATALVGSVSGTVVVDSAGAAEQDVGVSGSVTAGHKTKTAFSNLSAPTITYGTASDLVSGHVGAASGGQPVPSGEMIQVTLAGVTQNATVGSGGSFSVSFASTGLAVAGSPYAIGFSYAGDSNFIGTTGRGTLKVRPATTSLGLPYPTIVYGTPSTIVSGTLQSNSPLPVPAGEAVAVTLDGVTQEATVTASGTFTTTFATGTLSASGSPYTLDFSYTGDGNFTGSSRDSRLMVLQATTSFSRLSQPTITYGTSSVAVGGFLTTNSPQMVSTGEVVQVTLDGVTQSATLSSGGAFTTSFDSAGLAVSGSPYAISFSYSGDTNYGGATGSSTLQVRPATTSLHLPFPTIVADTPSVVIAGIIRTSSPLPVPVGEVVEVTLDGVTQSASIGSGGSFSTTFATAGLSASGSPYVITFSYAGDGNFTATSGQSTLTVVPAAPPITRSALTAAAIGPSGGLYGDLRSVAGALQQPDSSGAIGNQLDVVALDQFFAAFGSGGLLGASSGGGSTKEKN